MLSFDVIGDGTGRDGTGQDKGVVALSFRPTDRPADGFYGSRMLSTFDLFYCFASSFDVHHAILFFFHLSFPFLFFPFLFFVVVLNQAHQQ